MLRVIDGRIWIEQKDGIPKGYCVGTRKELKYLYVLHEFRRKGVGTKLVKLWYKWANSDAIILVEKDNEAAIRFYDILNFSIVGSAINEKKKEYWVFRGCKNERNSYFRTP